MTKKQKAALLCTIAAALIAAAIISLRSLSPEAVEEEPYTPERPEPPSISKDPIRMQEYTQDIEIPWRGATYKSTVHRQPADSTQTVSDELGQKYVDNIVSLRITAPSGQTVISRTLTIETFRPYADPDFLLAGTILEGLVFDKPTPQGLQYAVSLCHPETDEFLPLLLTISPQGSISITQDTVLDVEAEE